MQLAGELSCRRERGREDGGNDCQGKLVTPTVSLCSQTRQEGTSREDATEAIRFDLNLDPVTPTRAC